MIAPETPPAHADAWTAEEILRRVDAAGLRGRGGGWFPVARKWRAVRAEAGQPVLIANGAEGEPGSIKDRFVMQQRPERVISGIALAARAIGAREAIVYLKRSFRHSARALEAAQERLLAQAPELTPGRVHELPSIRVVRGEESYVGGEETAVLEALEGRRAWPRPKPPLPCAVGLDGRPTLVQNVETLSRVPDAVADPDAFRSNEATLVTLWGAVGQPGVHEVRLGTALRAILDLGGGAMDAVGMLFPAGPSASPLDATQLDTALDPAALRAAGSALGTASLLVVGSATCPLAVAVSLAGFFERESCGQCPPCTVGTANLARVVRALEAGHARAADVVALREVAGFMTDHGYCAHSRTAAGSVVGLLTRFRADVEAHIASGGCPRAASTIASADGVAPAVCGPFDPDSPERRRIEGSIDESDPAQGASSRREAAVRA